MNIRVYSNPFSSLLIAGSADALKAFLAHLEALHHSAEGHLALEATVVNAGDMATVELCMTDCIPVICTRVYRGKPEPIFDKRIFPSTVRLGAFLCDRSACACGSVAYALLPDTGKHDGTPYHVSDVLCTHCGRDVSPLKSRSYRFVSTQSESNIEERSIALDVDDFRRDARRVMRNIIERQGKRTVRAWRKGPSSVVIELGKQGIEQIRDECILPLLANQQVSRFHEHYDSLASIGRLDYRGIQFWIENIERYRTSINPPHMVFSKYLTVAWAICPNQRCGYQFLAAEDFCDKKEATWEDYQDIPIGNASCPRCRTPYYIQERITYRRS